MWMVVGWQDEPKDKMEKIFRGGGYKFLIIAFSFLVLLLISCATKAAPQKFSGATPLEWSVRLANSEMPRLTNAPKWDYTMGLFTLSLLKLDAVAPDVRYEKFSREAIGSLIAPDGTSKGYKPEEYQLDAINPGKTALALWQITHEEKYKNAAMILRKQLDTQP